MCIYSLIINEMNLYQFHLNNSVFDQKILTAYGKLQKMLKKYFQHFRLHENEEIKKIIFKSSNKKNKKSQTL